MQSTKIDLKRLAIEIKEMNYWNPLFKVLKEELSKRGYWKNQERGNPSKGYEVMKKKLNSIP